MPTSNQLASHIGVWQNLEYHGLYTAWNTDASPRHTLCGLKDNFWSRVGFVPTVSLSFSCSIVSPRFPSLDMFLSTILSLHPSHSALSASLFNGACFPFPPVLLLYDFPLWPCYLNATPVKPLFDYVLMFETFLLDVSTLFSRIPTVLLYKRPL